MPELPAALPPAERTVGQLVAETIRAYGGNFWRVLPLGIPIAVSSQISLGYDANVQTVVLFAFGPLISLAYVYACHLVHHVVQRLIAYLQRRSWSLRRCRCSNAQRCFRRWRGWRCSGSRRLGDDPESGSDSEPRSTAAAGWAPPTTCTRSVRSPPW